MIARAMVSTEGFTEQAQVTNWPLRLALVAVMVLIIAAALWGMRRGWVARTKRQSDVPAPHPWGGPAPESQDGATPMEVAGVYLGTATAGDWLDRIAVHGLGARSRVRLSWSGEGIAVDRDGAPSFLIPAADVQGVRIDRGVAGTVRARDSVVVITWRLGDRILDTGVRADDADGHRTLLDGLMAEFSRGESA